VDFLLKLFITHILTLLTSGTATNLLQLREEESEMKSDGEDDNSASNKKPASTQKRKYKGKVQKALKLQKAPNAPKRFKSAFIFFTMEMHPRVRKEMEENGIKDYKTPDVAKIVSEKWRNLTPTERAIWDEKARVDKERFMLEKSQYTGPWKVISSQSDAKKDPTAPKRPMSSFLSYSNGKRAAVKAKNPHFTNADISKNLAKMWKEAPQEEKQVYIDKEAKLREQYKINMAEWKRKNDLKKESGYMQQASAQENERELLMNRMLLEQQSQQGFADIHNQHLFNRNRPLGDNIPPFGGDMGYLSSVNAANQLPSYYQASMARQLGGNLNSWENPSSLLGDGLDEANLDPSFMSGLHGRSPLSVAFPQSQNSRDSRELLAAASLQRQNLDASSLLGRNDPGGYNAMNPAGLTSANAFHQQGLSAASALQQQQDQMNALRSARLNPYSQLSQYPVQEQLHQQRRSLSSATRGLMHPVGASGFDENDLLPGDSAGYQPLSAMSGSDEQSTSRSQRQQQQQQHDNITSVFDEGDEVADIMERLRNPHQTDRSWTSSSRGGQFSRQQNFPGEDESDEQKSHHRDFDSSRR